MEVEQKGMLAWVEAQQRGPEQLPAAEVERPLGLARGRPADGLLPCALGQRAEHGRFQPEWSGRRNPLDRPVRAFDEARAQGLVAPQHLTQAPLERADVEIATSWCPAML
jgi:hypothetical protein